MGQKIDQTITKQENSHKIQGHDPRSVKLTDSLSDRRRCREEFAGGIRSRREMGTRLNLKWVVVLFI